MASAVHRPAAEAAKNAASALQGRGRAAFQPYADRTSGIVRRAVGQVFRKTGLFPIVQSWRKRRRKEKLYGQFINAGELCLDVGANEGDRVATFLKLGARVVAVEPQPPCAKQLQRTYGGRSRFTLVAKALGEKSGTAEMLLSTDNTLSSLSREWIEHARETGRYGEARWDGKVEVEVTTLDALIDEYGLPRFCKIDVEGFEPQVLAGLSRPIQAISFEFSRPGWDAAFTDCLRTLTGIGPYEFNYSIFESMQLATDTWMSAGQIQRIYAGLPSEVTYGDIYARLAPGSAG